MSRDRRLGDFPTQKIMIGKISATVISPAVMMCWLALLQTCVGKIFLEMPESKLSYFNWAQHCGWCTVCSKHKKLCLPVISLFLFFCLPQDFSSTQTLLPRWRLRHGRPSASGPPHNKTEPKVCSLISVWRVNSTYHFQDNLCLCLCGVFQCWQRTCQALHVSGMYRCVFVCEGKWFMYFFLSFKRFNLSKNIGPNIANALLLVE